MGVNGHMIDKQAGNYETMKQIRFYKKLLAEDITLGITYGGITGKHRNPLSQVSKKSEKGESCMIQLLKKVSWKKTKIHGNELKINMYHNS
jgi:hypothetical protein